MNRVLKLLSWVIPVVVLGAFAVMFGGGLLHRGDYAVEAGAASDPPAAYTDGRPNLVGAMFYSAWCGSCAVLEPRLREVVPGFEGRAVEFTKFDFSMGQPDALTQKASGLGVERVYLANKGATGFMALIDRRDQRVVGQITMAMSDDDIRAAIDGAIREASAPRAEPG